MKFKSILNLSIKNIFLKKSAYLKVVAGFFFAFLIIFIVLFYAGSLSTAYDDYRDFKADQLVYDIHGAVNEEEEKEIRSFPQVKSIYSYRDLSLVYDSEKEITIDGTNHIIDDENKTVHGEFVGHNSDYAFCENKVLAFTAETGEEFILFGDTLQNENDMLISESLLEYLNIEERESLIGKEISINGFRIKWVDDEKQTLPFSKSGTICGIVNGNYGYDDFICFEDEENPAWLTMISLNTFQGNEDFFKRMEDIFDDNRYPNFAGQYQLLDMKIIEGQQTLCNRFLSIICVVLLSVICVYVASNQYYLLQKNSTFYGILKANGVDNKSVFLTHALELAITLVVALVLAFAVGVGAFFVMQLLFDDFVGINLIFNAGIAVGSFFGFLALCLVLAVLITLFIYNKILKKQPVYLLKK